MANETLTCIKQFAHKIWNPSIAYPGESIDPLLATRVSFSDFLHQSNQPLLDQQKAVNVKLPSINSMLIERIPQLRAIENEVMASGKMKVIPFSRDHGWIYISYEDDILKTLFSDSIINGDEDFASTQYTIMRNTKTNKAQIEVQISLDNGAEFNFKRTYEDGYEIYFAKDKTSESKHEMRLNYNRPYSVNGPEVTFVKRRPVINGNIGENEIYYQVVPTPSEANGILLINEQTVGTSASPPYDLSAIFSKSLDLLQEVTSSFHLSPQR